MSTVSRGISSEVTRLVIAAYSRGIGSSYSQRRLYGAAWPNRSGWALGSLLSGGPGRALPTLKAAWAVYSAAASASAGLSLDPVPAQRQMPFTGTTAPSQTVHGGASVSTSGGNWTYSGRPETRSVHHTRGVAAGSAICQRP